jgi:hypothetical protein
VSEARFESESLLQRAIAEHPEAIPSQDLGMGPLVTLALEIDFGHGPIDALAVDAQGRLVIIEFKRGTENPDVRKVVAQVLDYGSSLWKTSYEELEDAARRCHPGFETPMVEHVERRLAELNIDRFDPDAFRRGVETCLDTGDFVFLYIGRDLDARTQRIMRYLAEGPRMTFFAVEVDYFLDPVQNSSVLVPRASFVPSWVGEQSDRRGGAHGSIMRVEDAPAEVQELVKWMNKLGEELGLYVNHSRMARVYRPSAETSGVDVYLDGRPLDFDLETLRRHGAAAEADDLLQRLAAITGHMPTARKWPTVPVDVVWRNWDAVRDDVFVPYFKLRRGLLANE